jgi:hypothetical protein
MASNPASSATSSHNPFTDESTPPAIAILALQNISIHNHVPITLDYDDSTFSAWSAFFDTTFRKFGLLDHVDDIVDAQAIWHNAEWLQVDQCIISWLYNSMTPGLMQMVQVPQPTAYLIWREIHGLFLDNADQRTIYTLQEFHGLFQGDLCVHDYFSHLKQLADLLRDVGHPVSVPAMVINALCGLNSKFSHAISVLTMHKPLPTFLFTRDYLLQEEAH